jgi:hypothetical protein
VCRPEYVRALARVVAAAHEPAKNSSERLLVDIGGGTGAVTRAVCSAVGGRAVCVDPSAAMADHVEGDFFVGRVKDLPCGAMFRPPVSVTVAVCSAIHLMDAEDIAALVALARAHAQTVVVVTRAAAPTSRSWPWPPHAARAWRSGCAGRAWQVDVLARGLTGTHTVATHPESIPMRISRAEWTSMLRGRFWSHLSTLTDAEMEADVAAAEAGGSGGDVVFQDELVVHAFRSGGDHHVTE